jgi:hypothetical protein
MKSNQGRLIEKQGKELGKVGLGCKSYWREVREINSKYFSVRKKNANILGMLAGGETSNNTLISVLKTLAPF